MSHLRLRTVLLVLLATSPIAMPAVLGETGAASFVDVPGTLNLKPAVSNYTDTANLANVTSPLSSLNATWNPFYAAYPDLQGIVDTPLLAPTAVLQSTSTRLDVLQRLRFSNTEVINGVSQAWWRLPIGNLTGNEYVSMRIWRSDASAENVSSVSTAGLVTFTDPSNVHLVWSQDLNLSGFTPPFLYRSLCVPLKPSALPPVTSNLSGSLLSTFVSANAPNANQGDPPFGGMTGVSYAEFPYWSYNLAASVPACSYIVDANLSLMQSIGGPPPATYTQPQTLTVSGLASPFNPNTVTYNTAPPATPETATTALTIPVSGAEPCVPAVLYYDNTPQDCNGRVNINVTAAIQSDNAVGVNRGLTMRINETSAGYTFFAGSMDGAHNNSWPVQVQPYLNVKWTTPAVVYRFSYLASYAPIFPNQDYFVEYSVVPHAPHQYHLYFTSSDMGNDGRYESWYRVDAMSNATRVPFDTDASVVFTRGQANGIAGVPTACEDLVNITLFPGMQCSPQGGFGGSFTSFNFTKTFPNVLIDTNTYINLFVPLVGMQMASGYSYFQLFLTIHYAEGNFSIGSLDSSQSNACSAGANLFVNGSHVGKGFYLYSPADSSVLGCLQWSNKLNMLWMSLPLYRPTYGWPFGHQGYHISSISFDFVQHEVAPPPTGEAWFYVEPGIPIQSNLSIGMGTLGYGGVNYYPRYTLYGYFNAEDVKFVNTNKLVILIPINEPKTAFGKVFAWRVFRVIALVERCPIDALMTGFGLLTTEGTLTNIVNGNACVAQSILDKALGFMTSAMDSIFTFFKNILLAIGAFVLKLIHFFIEATQWILYIATQVVSVFLIAVVFAIIVFAPMYLGRGVYEWVRGGYDASILKMTLADGWSKVSILLGLLISFALMCVSIISAVASIVKGVFF